MTKAAASSPRRRIGSVGLLRGLAILAVCAVVFFPVYWMLLSAIQPAEYALSYPPPLVPMGFNGAAYLQLFSEKPIARWLATSGLVALAVVAGTMVVVVPAAYALARLHWRGRSAFGLMLLFTQMMPAAVVVAPVLTLYRSLGWTDSLPALALLHTAFVVPLCTWVLKSSFDTIPQEIVEAALMDGCNRLSVLPRIVLPLSKPGLVAVAVIAFFASWNEFLFASALIVDSGRYTASLGIATLMTQLDTPLFVLMAAGVVFSVMPVLFYMIIQRHVLRGLTAGSVKG